MQKFKFAIKSTQSMKTHPLELPLGTSHEDAMKFGVQIGMGGFWDGPVFYPGHTVQYINLSVEEVSDLVLPEGTSSNG